MKKRVSVLTAAVLCVVSVTVGAVAAGVIFKINLKVRPDSTLKAGDLTNTADEMSNKPTGITDSADFIGVEKAKEIALKKAGLSTSDVVFDRVELDKDSGIYHYEVEFRKDLTEYDADIKADDGTVISWEVDTNDHR